jgi:ParB family chromosome partitioning protein
MKGIAVSKTLQMVTHDQLTTGRNVREDEMTDVIALANSIVEVGLIQPLTVNEDLEVITGHRRLAAVRHAVTTKALPKDYQVPVVTNGELSEVDRTSVQLVENIQRMDLTPFEEADAFTELRESGVPQKDIAKAVSVSQAHVSRRIKLAESLPFIREAVEAAKISPEAALITVDTMALADEKHLFAEALVDTLTAALEKPPFASKDKLHVVGPDESVFSRIYRKAKGMKAWSIEAEKVREYGLEPVQFSGDIECPPGTTTQFGERIENPKKGDFNTMVGDGIEWVQLACHGENFDEIAVTPISVIDKGNEVDPEKEQRKAFREIKARRRNHIFNELLAKAPNASATINLVAERFRTTAKNSLLRAIGRAYDVELTPNPESGQPLPEGKLWDELTAKLSVNKVIAAILYLEAEEAVSFWNYPSTTKDSPWINTCFDGYDLAADRKSFNKAGK